MDQNIVQIYDKFLTCSGVSIDTRTISQGNLFFGIKGPNFDGNAYAHKALQAGAKYAIVDGEINKTDDRFIKVEDTLKTLQDLAIYHRQQFKGQVFALTGSNGKTTTKELIIRVLATKYRVQGTMGNLNNHLGVPLTLLALEKNTEIAIIEMGANKVGDIAELCGFADPTHGLITNIGTAHIEGFGGREGVIRGKSELFDHLRKKSGVVFINQYDHILNNMSKRFTDPHIYPGDGCRFKHAKPFVEYADEQDRIHATQLIGEYNYINIAAALSVGQYFGIDMDEAHEAICTFEPSNNRSQLVHAGTNKIILDAYNANPDSMKAAIDNLKHFHADRKVVLLGSMKELGDISDEMHREIVNITSNSEIHQIKFVGEEFHQISEANNPDFFSSSDDLIAYLKEHPISNSTVLIKGSRSNEMEKLIKVSEIWH